MNTTPETFALEQPETVASVTAGRVGSTALLGAIFLFLSPMSTEKHWPCACQNWARCEPVDLTKPMPNHHSKCEHYNASLIDVWRVSYDGASYVTDSEADAQEAVALYAEDPDIVPTVTKERMHREVYENLPEFDGF